MQIGILLSHPIQYYSPWFRGLSERVDLQVYYAHRQSPQQQAAAGFGVPFEWDIDLLAGYQHCFLRNVAAKPNVNTFSGCDTPEIDRKIAEGNFDAFIVCGWYLKCYWQAVSACGKAHIPVLLRGDSQLATPRSALKRGLKWIAYPRLLKRFQGFLAVGQHFAKYLRHYGVDEKRIFFVPHFVDNEWFAQRAATCVTERDTLRAKWGFGYSDFLALFAGKLIPEKNPLEFVSAVERAARREASIHGVIVGTGPLEEQTRSLASSLASPVHFAGFRNQTEMPSCYIASDVLALTSRSETWGLVVNEAFACSRPAIVSDVCGCAADLIDEGSTGFTYRSGDRDDLALKFLRLKQLKSSGQNFATAVRAKVARYDVSVAVTNTIDAINECNDTRS